MNILFSVVNKSDIRSEFGISKSTLNRWVKLGLWPKPIKIAGTTLWRRADIETFLEQSSKKSQGRNA